jgi:NADH-quinone oxidoreductase subunit K
MLGLIGMIIHRKHMIMMMMCLELVLVSLQTYGVYVGYSLGKVDVLMWVLAVMVVAALEVALALAIIIMLYHNQSSINSNDYSKLGDRHG